ncbi:hypothetical protein ACWOC1_06615 [Enterococcus quebecensis]|uniref:Uncharacterized protein n=1 Tax=Enterococcus quebecensis TaxID=903983 RepID=A0A1E5GRU2_9ENTE|nr:hypothetical protein [Enterococcus quebecensis]OEG15433.1 hypothetical protein BCR23_08155 [Enterococcus quebecensis]OJG74070.1 hypothetical protein RV12_GL000418 [Enterococcus quebecensis]
MGKSQESKTIAYQDILKAKSYLLELKEWHEALHFMTHFLEGKVRRNPQEMNACAEMFEVVYQNFDVLLFDIGEILNTE